jgi:hypothetical protein
VKSTDGPGPLHRPRYPDTPGMYDRSALVGLSRVITGGVRGRGLRKSFDGSSSSMSKRSHSRASS